METKMSAGNLHPIKMKAKKSLVRGSNLVIESMMMNQHLHRTRLINSAKVGIASVVLSSYLNTAQGLYMPHIVVKDGKAQKHKINHSPF